VSDLLLDPSLAPWIAALFGLLFGSFLNVCISRLPDDQSVVIPRSHCPHCGAWIAWFDNIPVLSYALLGGRCRACMARIPFRYPVVELLTAAVFFTAVHSHGAGWAGLKWTIFGAWMVALLFTDLETRILPDEFTKSGIVIGLALAPVVPLPPGLVSYVFFSGNPALASFVDSAFAALFLSGGMWALGAAYERIRGREGLGFGDVKLLGMMGAFLGLEVSLLVLILGSLLGTILGLIWIRIIRADSSNYELPFGSFLAFAGLMVVFVGYGRIALTR
jgi:leader peptidase (prepilin peptidase)/N-methyltransferase